MILEEHNRVWEEEDNNKIIEVEADNEEMGKMEPEVVVNLGNHKEVVRPGTQMYQQ